MNAIAFIAWAALGWSDAFTSFLLDQKLVMCEHDARGEHRFRVYGGKTGYEYIFDGPKFEPRESDVEFLNELERVFMDDEPST